MRSLVVLVGLALVVRSAAAQVARPDSLGFFANSPESLAIPESGNSIVVAGDPSQPGMYIVRNRFRPGQMSRPHFHDQDRFITVIRGTWWIGMGPASAAFDTSKMVAMKAGSVVKHPAGGIHFDGAKDEETIVQIMGMGPVATTRVNPDRSPVRQTTP